MTERQISQLPELLDEAVAVFENQQDGGVLALTSMVDGAGKPRNKADLCGVFDSDPALRYRNIPDFLATPLPAGFLFPRPSAKQPVRQPDAVGAFRDSVRQRLTMVQNSAAVISAS